MYVRAVIKSYYLICRFINNATGIQTIFEPLNGYRIKEKLPANLSEFKLEIGIPVILQEGKDITIVTYGSMCRIAQDAIKILNEHNISCELIDVQSLLPFDIHHSIVESL